MMIKLSARFMSADKAAQLIKSGDYICIGDLVSLAHPECITDAVIERFETTGEPNGLCHNVCRYVWYK